MFAIACAFAPTIALAAPQCSDQCKVALIDGEFEFSYHSGASSTIIAGNIYAACGQDKAVETECAKKIVPDEGSIVYLEYAACVHEKVKADCQERYDANH